MNEIIPKRYAGLVGLGIMFMWGSGLLAWVDLWKSSPIAAKIAGLLGSCLISASGIAIFLYTSSLEEEANRLKQRSDSNEAEARMWKTQAQEAMARIENK